MIIDLQPSAIEILHALPFEFYLTGSRKLFPSHISDDSDHDFFVQSSQEVCDELLDNGFVTNSASEYLDKGLVVVLTKDHVDVQLRKDVGDWNRKQAVLMALPEETRWLILHPGHSRQHLSDVWDSL